MILNDDRMYIQVLFSLKNDRASIGSSAEGNSKSSG
jgi:hypothetical protein